MIAPVKEPPELAPPTNIARARNLVASMLLQRRSSRAQRHVSAWKAWLFTGWILAVLGAYIVHLLGWFS